MKVVIITFCFMLFCSIKSITCWGRCTGVDDKCHNKNYTSDHCLDYLDLPCKYKEKN